MVPCPSGELVDDPTNNPLKDLKDTRGKMMNAV
jgi:hypothetical protein